MSALSRSEILHRQGEGWSFDSRGVRVANGWAVWARDPRGDLRLEILSDPTDEPEKWRDDAGPKDEGAQLQLALAP